MKKAIPKQNAILSQFSLKKNSTAFRAISVEYRVISLVPARELSS